MDSPASQDPRTIPNMHLKIKQQIADLAKQNPTQEICGLIYLTFNDIFIYPCENVTVEDPANNFEISSDDFIKCVQLGKICGIYHSHTTGTAAFSEEDLATADESCFPIYVYAVEDDTWSKYIPKSYVLPLEGRNFCWGENDCFSSIEIYYRQVLGIYIKDFDRDETWQQNPSDFVRSQVYENEFEIVSDLGVIKLHDILVFSNQYGIAKHFAVFIGNSRVLHHYSNRLSTIDFLSSLSNNRLTYIIRHKSFL